MNKVKHKLNKKNIVTKFRPKIRSRHPSHGCLRGTIQRMPFSSVIRFGSTTPCATRVELNTIEAIKNSSSKLRMKNCFKKGQVKTAEWIQPQSVKEVKQFFNDYRDSGIVTKSHFGSRGQGNTLIKTEVELNNWLNNHSGVLSNYIVEKFYNYSREYRLHVTKNGCFYTCRKMLKQDTPENKRWYRNDSNSIWIKEENPDFNKPSNWEEVVTESVKALKSTGLDFGAVDLRIQSDKIKGKKVNKNPEFIVIEINSAPSFGEITQQKYKEILPNLLQQKYNEQ